MLCAHFSVPVQCLFLSRAAALFCFGYSVSVPVTLPVFVGTVSFSETFLVIFNKIIRRSAQNHNFSLDLPPPPPNYIEAAIFL